MIFSSGAIFGQPGIVIDVTPFAGEKIMVSMGIRKVLVVDGDPSMRTGCTQMLVENGFDVAEASNGIEAVSAYSDFQPDMVFMDITMPDMDCLAALQEIIVMDPNAKVAMAIVVGQQASVLVALKLGAMDFVIKPLDQKQILGTIERASRKLNPAEIS